MDIRKGNDVNIYFELSKLGVPSAESIKGMRCFFVKDVRSESGDVPVPPSQNPSSYVIHDHMHPCYNVHMPYQNIDRHVHREFCVPDNCPPGWHGQTVFVVTDYKIVNVEKEGETVPYIRVTFGGDKQRNGRYNVVLEIIHIGADDQGHSDVKYTYDYGHQFDLTDQPTALSGRIDIWLTDYKDIYTEVQDIKTVIPQEASAQNQLADKNYVNQHISEDSATFRGTSAKDLTEEQFLAWANSLEKQNNDYVFWDTVDGDSDTIFKRYKYNGQQWLYEYTITQNNFTPAQWATINSGLTSTDKQSLDRALSAIENNITMSNTTFGRTDELSIQADEISLHSEAPRFQYQNDANIRPDEISVSNVDTSNDVTTTSTVFVTPETVKFYQKQEQDGQPDVTREQSLTIDDVEKLHSTVVAVTAQQFTSAQKQQARENIDAASTAAATVSADGLMSSSDKDKLDGLTEKITIPSGTNDLHVDNYDDKVQIDAKNLIQNVKNDVSISSRDGAIEIKSFDDLTLSTDEGNRIIMNIDSGGSIVMSIGQTSLTISETKLQRLAQLLA